MYMGIHKEPEIAMYWNTDPSNGPLHPLVRRNIGLNRWQQLDRFFHISKPKPGEQESPFAKVEPLNQCTREAARKYWNPTTDVAIDECIERFQGRAKETVRIPSKPTPEGFKIWALANNGYVLDWLFHAKSTGPVGLSSYWIEERGFSATQAVVLDLLHQAGLNRDNKHIVWLDNLFTSARLLSTLREQGFGAAGTVRSSKSKAELLAEDPVLATDESQAGEQHQLSQSRSSQSQKPRRSLQKEQNRGLDSSLLELKNDYGGQIPWGKLYGCLSADRKVLQFAWKDQNVVLFMSTVSKGDPDFIKNLQLLMAHRQS
jgi:hypothetical protein